MNEVSAITVAMAASISGLMAVYCALRSTRGIAAGSVAFTACNMAVLSLAKESSAGVRASANDAGLGGELIRQIGELTNHASGVSGHHRVVRDVANDDRARANECVLADDDAGQNRGV